MKKVDANLMVILREISENDSVWFGLGKIMIPGLFVV